jgi:D-glycero-D-manno-heptose 1,7-bisphosphate phosphatase
MNRAVFIDRDGTISEEVGYIGHPDLLRIYPWAPSAIRKLNLAGIRAILATNQAGIARGYFREESLESIHARLEAALAREGARLDAIYYCPHHPEAAIPSYRQDCDCRKPKPGMVLRAAEKFALDLSSSFVIGDRYCDVETAHRAGARGVLVLSGYGNGEYTYQSASWPRQPDHVAADLSEAVDWILARI